MQLNSALFDDLSKLASGAVSSLLDMRREVESAVSARLDNLLEKHNFVPKDAFDAVRAMAVKAREENEELKARVTLLEKKLEDLASR